MKRVGITFVTTLFLLSSLALHAQVDMRGTDFWLTFGSNCNRPSDEQNLQIRIVSSEEVTTGTIYFTHLQTSVSFSIAAGQVYTYNLSEQEKQAAYNLTAGISNFSIHITTSELVTVYALNQHLRTTDASNILPVTVLGTDYYHVSYTPTYSPAYYSQDAYIVIATEDSTQLYHKDTLEATLNAGQIYYRTYFRDMTSDRITTNKPVAFFAANQGCQIPSGYSFIDNLFQQLAPVNTYGKKFLVPVSLRGRDFARIIVSQDSTNITQIGGKIRPIYGGQTKLTNLNAGQWVELETSLDSNGCYIQADKPVGVCTYLTSTSYNSWDDLWGFAVDSIADPAQAWLPAIEQKIYTALIAPFIPIDSTNLNEHYALIITPTATKNNTTMKIGTGAEQPLSGGKWYDNAAAGISFYSLPLTHAVAAYLIINREGGLIVMGYGYGIAESYYYLSFSAMRSLDVAFYVNDVHYQELAAEFICTQPVQFRAEIEGDISKQPGFLKWYINDVEEVAARDQLSWNKILPPAVYQIKIEALMNDNIITKTIESTLILDTVSISNRNNNTTICVGDAIYLNGIPSGGKWKGMNQSVAEINAYGALIGRDTGIAEIKYIAEKRNCTDSTSILIKVVLTTVDATTTPEICDRENGTIALTVHSEEPATVEYIWKELPDTTAIVANLKAGTYNVFIRDTFCIMEETFVVEYVDGPVADFELSEYNVINQTSTLTDISKGTVQSWNWDMGDGNKQTGKTVFYTYLESGCYTVFLEVIDTNGCIDTISKSIQIYEGFKIFIPNAFTPNGDGLNDIFKPVMQDPEYHLKAYEMIIYDRWGNVAFATADCLSGWNGNDTAGRPFIAGIYHCIIRFTDASDKEFTYQTSVTLVR